MKTTLITDKCYACEYEEYCNGSYCCLRNRRFTETIIDKAQRQSETDIGKGELTMSRAEKFIQERTKNCSNLMQVPTLDDKGNIVQEAHPWLTPEDALRAVEIAREEMYEWIRNNIRNYAFMVTDEFEGDVDVDAAINDLKQAMKDECDYER